MNAPAEDTFVPLPSWATSEEQGLGRTLGCHALAVYVALLGFRQRFTTARGLRGPEARRAKAAQTFYATLPQVAAAAGVSRATVCRVLKRLRTAGLVEEVERGGPGAANVYRVRDRPAGRLLQQPGSISVRLPASPTETRSSQAETPVRSEVRSEITDGKGDGSSGRPFVIQSNDESKEPRPRDTLLAEYRELVRGFRDNPAALAGARRSLAGQLHVSEEQAGALLNGANHG